MAKLLDVIEFFDDAGTTMVARVPATGEAEIKWGAQLTVRESQTAVFFRDGKAQVIFGPGRHVLKTQNTPVLTKLITSTVYGAESPFRAEVYFLNMKLFRNLKWGTKEPIVFRDPELQMVRLRSNGMFSLQIKDPSLFLNRMVGTQHIFHDQNIQDYLRSIATSRLVNVLAEQVKSIFDLPHHYDALGGLMKAVLADDFIACGLELVDFFINAISLPDEVQAVVDERTSIKAIGDLGNYTKFKVAKSIEEAAKQPGGTQADGVGMGAEMGMGLMIASVIKDAFQNDKKPAQTTESSEEIIEKIKKCKSLLDMGAISQEEFDKKKAELLSRI